MKAIKENRQKLIHDNQKIREEMASTMQKQKEEKFIDEA